MDELSTVSNALSSQNVAEDGDDDVVGDVAGVFNDAVKDQEHNTDILEAVAGKKESNTGTLDGITEDGLNFGLDSAGVIDELDILDEGEKFGFSFSIVGVLC